MGKPPPGSCFHRTPFVTSPFPQMACLPSILGMDTQLPSHEAHLDAIALQAREDYRRAPTEYRPPYPIGSKEFDAYERGWMQALKRNPMTNTAS